MQESLTAARRLPKEYTNRGSASPGGLDELFDLHLPPASEGAASCIPWEPAAGDRAPESVHTPGRTGGYEEVPRRLPEHAAAYRIIQTLSRYVKFIF